MPPRPVTRIALLLATTIVIIFIMIMQRQNKAFKVKNSYKQIFP
jgi:hypothetical protein